MPSTALVSKSKTTTQVEDAPTEPVQSDTAADVLAETDALMDEIDRLLDADAVQSLKDALTDLDDVKPFTLADAIREGSSVTDQAVGAWTTAKGETCALSAAMLSVRARGLA